MVNWQDSFKDKIPDGYSMMGLCYAGNDPHGLRKVILEKHPEAKFNQLSWDEIHQYRFFAWLPKKVCDKEKYPKFIC